MNSLTRSALLFLITVLFAAPVAAQSRAFACLEQKGELPKEQASKIADKVQQLYKKIDTLTGEFAQHSYLAALDTAELSTGTISFSKPAKMRWEYLTPELQTFLLIDKSFKLYQPREQQLLVDTLDKLLVSELPVTFLLGLGDLTRDFDVLGACKSPEGIVLKLKFKKDGGDLSALDLLVEESKGLVRGAQIKDFGGNINSITFGKLVMNKPLPKERFVLSVPAGTDVIDKASLEHEK